MLDRPTIEDFINRHRQAPQNRLLQEALARDITIRVHSADDYEMAVRASRILFGQSTTEELQSLDEDTLLSVFEGVPQVSISRSEFASATTVTDLLSVVSKGVIFSSKGEARKMIQGGGVGINKEKVADANAKPDYPLLQGKYLLTQKGKKNYFLIRVEA